MRTSTKRIKLQPGFYIEVFGKDPGDPFLAYAPARDAMFFGISRYS